MSSSLAGRANSVTLEDGVSRAWTTILAGQLGWSQDGVLETLAATEPTLVRRRPAPTAPSIGFHAWHLARWADRHHVALRGWRDPGAEPATEIWIARDVPAAWGFGDTDLGDYGIGAGLDDDASAALPLPDVELLTVYVRDSFAAVVDEIARYDDAGLDLRIVDLYGDESRISEVILGLASHTDRHLGMMEALRGVLGEHGTVTV